MLTTTGITDKIVSVGIVPRVTKERPMLTPCGPATMAPAPHYTTSLLLSPQVQSSAGPAFVQEAEHGDGMAGHALK